MTSRRKISIRMTFEIFSRQLRVARASCFFDALEEGDDDTYRALVLAFFVSNGWIQSPFTAQNSIQGSNFRHREVFDQYLRGLALLGGAELAGSVAETKAVQISTDRVKKSAQRPQGRHDA